MKCVCPMGGDRVCPDDCPLAIWAGMPQLDRRKQRKPIAEKLYKQGFTMEQIATQLGVTQQTISKDLLGLQPDCKPSRPKGGRPKGKGGAKPERRKNQSVTAEEAARQILDAGKTYPEAEADTGLSNTVLRSAVAREEGRRDPEIDRAGLSRSAQEKLDSAIRQHKRGLEAMFAQRVQDEVRRRIDEMVLPHWKEQIAEAQKLYERRHGAMDKATFNKIRRALHPDSRNSISDKVLAEAFDTFMSLEKYLLNEKDSPTHFDGLPKSWAEWEKAKRDATAARRAKRNGHPVARRI